MAISGMTRPDKSEKKPKKRTLLRRWIANNLGVLVLIMVVMELAFIYAIQTFYYAGARQKLTAELTSVVNILSRYAQDSETNLSFDHLINIIQIGPYILTVITALDPSPREDSF